MTDVNVYAGGVVCCSVCVPREMPREQVETEVSEENPTGLDHGWKISDEPFSDEQPNPHPCERDAERLHYLMVC